MNSALMRNLTTTRLARKKVTLNISITAKLSSSNGFRRCRGVLLKMTMRLSSMRLMLMTMVEN